MNTRPLLIAGLISSALTFLPVSFATAASGTMNCDPEAISQMDPKLQKKMERMCSRKTEQDSKDKARDEKHQAWYDKHVKGHKEMEKVVKANNGRHPSDVEDLGDQVIWKYRAKSNDKLLAECKEYVFSGGGNKLESRKTYACE
ncbi:MAG: hypothetical protein H6999_09360 [Hahellaceae bacterium]|nr:hypothetical protein [Hahellaceae bacterium]MCP5169950.1 hypothetical protein [Hahellaceae bacterium]